MPASSRPFAEPDDLRAAQGLAQEVWRLEPESSEVDTTVGELAWGTRQHIGREHEWRRRLWLDRDRVVAFGWIRLPDTLAFQVLPGCEELVDDVLDWFEGTAEGDELTTLVGAGRFDAALGARGFAEDADAPTFLYNVRELGEIEEPSLPGGYRLGTMAEESSLTRRVAVHRAAFHPSRVTEESYANVVETWPYRPELDCFVEAPDGTFASYALAWLDDANGVGELEPVGTHPDHRRRGLGRAVNLFALQQLRAAGAGRATVGCRGDDAYPVPKRLYRSVGFRELVRYVPFVKRGGVVRGGA